MMPILLIALGFLRGPVRSLLAGIPRPAWIALAGVAALASLWHLHSADKRRAVREAIATDDARYRAAQAVAAAAARATVTRVENAQSAITKDTGHATDTALAGIAADYAAYRLRHRTSQGAARACDLPNVSAGPAVAVDTARSATDRPATDVVGIAEQGDVYRTQVLGWQSWYAAMRTVDRTPVPPSPAIVPTTTERP